MFPIEQPKGCCLPKRDFSDKDELIFNIGHFEVLHNDRWFNFDNFYKSNTFRRRAIAWRMLDFSFYFLLVRQLADYIHESTKVHRQIDPITSLNKPFTFKLYKEIDGKMKKLLLLQEAAFKVWQDAKIHLAFLAVKSKKDDPQAIRIKVDSNIASRIVILTPETRVTGAVQRIGYSREKLSKVIHNSVGKSSVKTEDVEMIVERIFEDIGSHTTEWEVLVYKIAEYTSRKGYSSQEPSQWKVLHPLAQKPFYQLTVAELHQLGEIAKQHSEGGIPEDEKERSLENNSCGEGYTLRRRRHKTALGSIQEQEFSKLNKSSSGGGVAQTSLPAVALQPVVKKKVEGEGVGDDWVLVGSGQEQEEELSISNEDTPLLQSDKGFSRDGSARTSLPVADSQSLGGKKVVGEGIDDDWVLC